MPKFIPTHDFHVCQGGSHRLKRNEAIEFPDGHPMVERLRSMGPAYVTEEKAPPPPPVPDFAERVGDASRKLRGAITPKSETPRLKSKTSKTKGGADVR